MLGGEQRVDVDGLGWIDDDSLQVVCGTPDSLLFGNAVQLYYLM
jgi:hypothetical protein